MNGMNGSKMNKKVIEFIKPRYVMKYNEESFAEALAEYMDLRPFKANENVWETNQNVPDDVHLIARLVTQYHLTEAFKAMKIDMSDDNVMEDLSSGNIGTPGRIAKVWMGANLDDDRELGGGRWSRKPRLASFPNTNDTNIPITKRVDIISNCSHHFIPFTTIAREESYAIISYIPDKFVLGISKLQRLADWVSQRFFLQEDLTKKLYEAVSEASQTDSVYVGLFNMVHGCESMRGAKSNDGSFTSEYYGGKFADPELRKQIRS
jgi:GTP cyclohydrolase I